VNANDLLPIRRLALLLQIRRVVQRIPAGGGVHEDHEGLGALLLEPMRHALRDADEVARAYLSRLVPPGAPPPPDVPVLDASKVGDAVSLRAQLEEHRKNPTCASCHSRLDPLGFALENFDAIGAWRDKDGKLPIDTSAKLPDGRGFNGPQELKGILMADRDKFAACVSEKLLTYALGRGLERYDRPVVKQIVGKTGGQGYRFSALVLEIVNSLPFRMRRAS